MVKLFFIYFQDLEKAIDDKDDTVRDIAVKGKGLQDYCKGKTWII